MNLCLGPLHGQASLDKGPLTESCGVSSVVVAHGKSRGWVGAGRSMFLNRGVRLRYWVVIVQVVIVGLHCFRAVFLTRVVSVEVCFGLAVVLLSDAVRSLGFGAADLFPGG